MPELTINLVSLAKMLSKLYLFCLNKFHDFENFLVNSKLTSSSAKKIWHTFFF